MGEGLIVGCVPKYPHTTLCSYRTHATGQQNEDFLAVQPAFAVKCELVALLPTSVECIRSTRSLSSPLKRRPMLSRFNTSCPPSITEDTRLPLRLGEIYQNQQGVHG